MLRTLELYARDLLHFVAPALCPGCDLPLTSNEEEYCLACRASLPPAPFPRDIMGDLLAHFSGDELALASVGALYDFPPDGTARRLVYALKYRGCYNLGVQMGRELGRGLRMFAEFADARDVVPVPLHRARLRERGYNQAEAIARGVAEALGGRVVHALARGRHTRSQTALDAAGRRKNVGNAFSAATDVREATLLLCDDVCTTGATLNACAELLLAAGARVVRAATLAKDPLRTAEPTAPPALMEDALGL